MRKIFLCSLIIILSFKSNSQIKYEAGYYIDNSGNVVNCLIKNTDWKDNPKEFTYKLSTESTPQKGKIEDVSEFSVVNKFKFKRYSVDIDRSSDNLNDMGYNRAPEFKSEQLFLKILFEGKANLYFYEGQNLFRYFYSVDNSNAKQLIYKRYLDAENRVTKNNEFKKQLLDSLQCQSLSLADVEDIEYDENDLVDLFTKYNECQNSKTVIYHIREKNKNPLSLAIRPGVNVSNLSIENIATYTGIINFGTKASLRLGVQSEYILPFNKGKWAITLEPTFQYYKGETMSNSKPIKAEYNRYNFQSELLISFF